MSSLSYIYDLNGVIVNTLQYKYEGWQWLSAELGYKLSDKQFLKIKDIGAREALDKILKWSYSRISEADKQHYLHELSKRYLNAIDQLQPQDVFKGFREFNTESRNNSIKVALVSTGTNLIRIIDRLDLVLDFDAIVDAGMADSTDYQDLLRLCLEKLQLEPTSCTFVGSSADGLKAAVSLNMNTIAFGATSMDFESQVRLTDWQSIGSKQSHEVID